VVKIIPEKWQIKMKNMDSGIWGIILDPIYELFNPRKMANENGKYGFRNLVDVY